MSFLWWDFVLTSLSGAGEKGPFPKDIPDAQLSFSISGTPPPPLLIPSVQVERRVG